MFDAVLLPTLPRDAWNTPYGKRNQSGHLLVMTKKTAEGKQPRNWPRGAKEALRGRAGKHWKAAGRSVAKYGAFAGPNAPSRPLSRRLTTRDIACALALGTNLRAARGVKEEGRSDGHGRQRWQSVDLPTRISVKKTKHFQQYHPTSISSITMFKST